MLIIVGDLIQYSQTLESFGIPHTRELILPWSKHPNQTVYDSLADAEKKSEAYVSSNTVWKTEGAESLAPDSMLNYYFASDTEHVRRIVTEVIKLATEPSSFEIVQITGNNQLIKLSTCVFSNATQKTFFGLIPYGNPVFTYRLTKSKVHLNKE